MTEETYDPALIRGDWVPRLRLARRILEQLSRRRAYIDSIATVAQPAGPEGTTALELERLSRTWTLVDNLLGVYATVAYHLNLRTTKGRLAVARHIATEPVPPSRSFLERVWLYEAFKQAIASGEIRPRGISTTEYLTRLAPLLDRTISNLSQRYVTQRTFHQRYEPFAMAHRHGRATFNLAFDRTQDGETTNIIIRHSTDRATVIRSRDRSKPTLVHELIFDDAYQAETAAVLQVTTADIANYTRLVTEIEAGIPAFLAAIEHGDNRSYIGTLPYILLAAPYADEELPIAAGFVQGD